MGGKWAFPVSLDKLINLNSFAFTVELQGLVFFPSSGSLITLPLLPWRFLPLLCHSRAKFKKLGHFWACIAENQEVYSDRENTVKFGACRYVSCHPEILLGGEALFKGSPEENSRELSEKGSLKVILFHCVEAFRSLRHKKQHNFVFKVSAEWGERELCLQREGGHN